jgi:hypothetical protein
MAPQTQTLRIIRLLLEKKFFEKKFFEVLGPSSI